VALETQLNIVGEQQGPLLGPGAGRPEAECRVLWANQQITVPRNPHTGMPTNKRHHKPFMIRREVSAASIGIRQAFASMEKLTEVRLNYLQPTPLGVLKNQYTVQLFNAFICGVHLRQPLSRTSVKTAHLPLNEVIGFTYLSIRWTWHNPLLVSDDDWLIAR
jgi:type VI secretion system secreted protein Hcp